MTYFLGKCEEVWISEGKSIDEFFVYTNSIPSPPPADVFQSYPKE